MEAPKTSLTPLTIQGNKYENNHHIPEKMAIHGAMKIVKKVAV